MKRIARVSLLAPRARSSSLTRLARILARTLLTRQLGVMNTPHVTVSSRYIRNELEQPRRDFSYVSAMGLVFLGMLAACGDDAGLTSDAGSGSDTGSTSDAGSASDADLVVDAVPTDGVGRDARPLDADAQDSGHDASASTAPPNAQARFPWNGFATGSPHVPEGAVTDHPLHPKLMWEDVAEADHYQVQMTRECAVEGFRACAFSSPDLDESTNETTFRPAEALAVSTSVPVGSRYYWRVRACDSTNACSLWTEIRYLNVGRDDRDFNGDGYADLLVGAPGHDDETFNEGAAFLFFGTTDGLSERSSIALANPLHDAGGHFGESAASVGDLNADGFADFLVGAPDQDESRKGSSGSVYVYLGGPAGPALAPDAFLDSPVTSMGFGLFGGSVAGMGDVNGDGFADFVIGEWIYRSAFVYFGNSSAMFRAPDVSLTNPRPESDGRGFAGSVAGAGDLNGDGYPDLVVSGAGRENGYVYFGEADEPLGAPAFFLDNPSLASDGLGSAVSSAGDVNGDGYSDLLVGARANRNAVLFFGGLSGVESLPNISLENPSDQESSRFGSTASSAGDVNGDGYGDVLVGAPSQDSSSRQNGRVYVYYGGDLGPEPSLVDSIDNPQDGPFSEFGSAVRGGGDVNGDGHADVIVGARQQSSTSTVEQEDEGMIFEYLGYGTGLDTTPTLPIDHPTDQRGAFFGTAVE